MLSVVAPTASGVGATLRLLHVAPVPHNLVSESGRVVMYADQEMGRLDAQWRGYLAGVAATMHDAALECVVRFGDPAREIVAEAEAWGAELIAMTTARPRWRGVRRVVRAVSRKARIPVLLYLLLCACVQTDGARRGIPLPYWSACLDPEPRR